MERSEESNGAGGAAGAAVATELLGAADSAAVVAGGAAVVEEASGGVERFDESRSFAIASMSFGACVEFDELHPAQANAPSAIAAANLFRCMMTPSKAL